MMLQAKEMATRLQNLFRQLTDLQVIEQDSWSSINEAVKRLKRTHETDDWRYDVTPTKPIKFKCIRNKHGKLVQPVVTTQIEASPASFGEQDDGFRLLNTTIELWDETRMPISRWHIDLANDTQEGPKFHLQGGGHSSGNTDRNSDYRIDIPRWAYPPMDLILVCEMIVANFFPTQWHSVRETTAWVKLVQDAEKYCLSSYHNQVVGLLNTSGKNQTVLQRLWA